ncbi:MAG: PSD1 domain-containing protein [Cytophagales bacterium]|nr:PSD1 domain-containing protein [Armatimonadota bacterium]
MRRRFSWLGKFCTVRGAVFGLTAALALLLAASERQAVSSNESKAPPVSAEASAFFETKVRPVLADNCTMCHGPEENLGGLRLDSREALLRGGDSGPAMVPGDPDRSLLLSVVRHSGKIKMPKGGRLKDAEIGALADWVRSGAPWPRTQRAASLSETFTVAKEPALTPDQRRFWSLRPVRSPLLPPVKHQTWGQSPLDRFVLAKLEAKGLKPAPPASKRALIRRVTFDLIGLPPTPAEVDAFLSDRTPEAFAKVVDRLLSSPRYGEKSARHWLDVARYADTKGYVFTEDRNYPNAYTYRDWVIEALNKDLPYDRFIQLQLAADRLPLPSSGDKKQLAALGFLTVGRRFLNNTHDIIDDRIDVTMRGFQGFTVACARCHNHKFDPIPTKDYYSLYGVFASTRETEPIIAPDAVAAPYAAHDAKFQSARGEAEAVVRTQTARLREAAKTNSSLEGPIKQALQAVRLGELPQGDHLLKLEAGFEPPERRRLVALRSQIETLRQTYPPAPPKAMALTDLETPVTPRVFKRGNASNPGDVVPRRFLLALSPKDRPRPEWNGGSGRLELARAIASKENPLTARVFVNRVWMQHFGAGIVRTPSDFGRQGERPTHPELLDHLSARFMESGWSIKKLHRRILLSSTYQQSSEINPKSVAADPENRFLWRMNRRRLDLEQMRDALFLASGKLDTSSLGGPSVELWEAPFSVRRAVYGRVERQNLPGTFRTFDFASPDATSAQRFQTTVPQQALFLMNSPLAIDQARALAGRTEVMAKPAGAARIRQLYLLLFSRLPTAGEVAVGARFLGNSDPEESPPEMSGSPWRYGYGEYDAGAARTAKYQSLTHFTGKWYQGNSQFPDSALRSLLLNAGGGHPGGSARQAAIRRWTAPISGTVAITGTLRHASSQGDGIRGRVVSSRLGLLGEWVVHHGSVAAAVADVAVIKGDTLDFMVDCRTGDAFDSFAWSPVITRAGSGDAWQGESQFAGPAKSPLAKPLTKWEQYAQALLMTNEFTFLD